jgi:hypothetical protein
MTLIARHPQVADEAAMNGAIVPGAKNTLMPMPALLEDDRNGALSWL